MLNIINHFLFIIAQKMFLPNNNFYNHFLYIFCYQKAYNIKTMKYIKNTPQIAQKDNENSIAEFAKDFHPNDIITFKQAIINRISDLASKSGLTISKLAIKSGMPPATLYDIVQTKNTKLPNLLTVKRLCDTFNMTLSQFFDVEQINNAPTE